VSDPSRVLGSAAELDFARWVRADDLVVWGQGSAEPRGLTRRLLAQRADVGGFRCFVGTPSPDTAVTVEHADHVRFFSYAGGGVNGKLIGQGALDVLPVAYSELPGLLSAGPLRADVCLVQVAPPDSAGRFSMGLACEYLDAAVAAARVVVAEVNPGVPRLAGRALRPDEIDVLVAADSPPAAITHGHPSPAEQAIAERIAGLVEDGATLQVGLGRLPDAVVRALAGHRHLGVHSGLIGDSIAELMRSGAIDNSRKRIDPGVTVTGLLLGSPTLFEFVDGRSDVVLHPTAYTHDPRNLIEVGQLAAINSAVEIDLTGQVNAEVGGGRYVGAVGGAAEFLRSAARSPGGLPILGMSATGPGGTRIVAALSGPVSTPRSDVGLVVTEFGVADLRGQSLRARRERMLAIAHPDHRDELAAASS
jgi:acetyl-CoA hydrolase